jgi:hypothetical protein
MVIAETRAIIDMLAVQGFWWQSDILQKQLNRRLAIERKVRRSLRVHTERDSSSSGSPSAAIYAEGASLSRERASSSLEVAP